MIEPPRRQLHRLEIDDIRATRGRSILLFITDRCPVGCAHCSVDSRRDSPTISDFELFGEIVDWLCSEPGIEVVGISGGEPFVEKRGLTMAAERIAAAGRLLVVYTSGIWAVRPEPPGWVRAVLDRCSTVYLSTDGFHSEGVPDHRWVNAARSISAAGAWIVVQVLNVAEMVEAAQRMLTTAFGPRYQDFAELSPITALTAGRGADVFTLTPRTAGRDFGPCRMVASPMVRYDGLTTGCCNESVIMGKGPARLRRPAASGAEVSAAIADFHADPVLRAIGGVGPGTLTLHPRFEDLAGARFSSICDLCWKMLDRTPPDAALDPLLAAVNLTLVSRT